MSKVTVRLSVDGKAVDIFDERMTADYPYYVELDAIKSGADIMKMAKHLSKKNWLTDVDVARFIVIAEKELAKRKIA